VLCRWVEAGDWQLLRIRVVRWQPHGQCATDTGLMPSGPEQAVCASRLCISGGAACRLVAYADAGLGLMCALCCRLCHHWPCGKGVR
jgi:hypothetical protein